MKVSPDLGKKLAGIGIGRVANIERKGVGGFLGSQFQRTSGLPIGLKLEAEASDSRALCTTVNYLLEKTQVEATCKAPRDWCDRVSEATGK